MFTYLIEVEVLLLLKFSIDLSVVLATSDAGYLSSPVPSAGMERELQLLSEAACKHAVIVSSSN